MEYETALNMLDLLGRAQAEVPALEAKISAAQGAQAELDTAAIKSAALEERDAKPKAKAAEDNRANILRMQGELEAARKKVGIIQGELKHIEGAAVAEVRARWRPRFDAAVREFAALAIKAADAEKKIQEVRTQAEAEVNKVTLLPVSAVPPLRSVLLVASGLPEYSPISRLLREIKDLGIEL